MDFSYAKPPHLLPFKNFGIQADLANLFIIGFGMVLNRLDGKHHVEDWANGAPLVFLVSSAWVSGILSALWPTKRVTGFDFLIKSTYLGFGRSDRHLFFGFFSSSFGHTRLAQCMY